MVIKDLVVTGIVKLLRSLNVDTLVVEKINEANKDEINALKGVTSNIQQQIDSANTTVSNATTAQDNWKSQIANAINGIPRPSASNVSSNSALSSYVAEANKVKTAISGATAADANVLSGKKFVNADGALVTGTMVDWTGKPDHIDASMMDDVNKWFKVAVHRGFHNYSWAENSYEYLTYSEVASKIGLNANMLLEDYTILGIHGGIINYHLLGGGLGGDDDILDTGDCMAFSISGSGYYDANDRLSIHKSAIANAIGLISAKIVSGNTILGVSGYTSNKNTSDANADACNITKGRTAYVKGAKVTGTLQSIPDFFYFPGAALSFRKGMTSYGAIDGTDKTIEPTNFISVFYMNDDEDDDGNYVNPGFYVPSGSINEIMILASRLGNASAADVLSGKTFTSENGLKITGTIASKSSGTSSTEVTQAERTDYLEVTIPAGYYPSGCKLHVPGFQLASDWKSGYIKACGFRGSKVISAGKSATMTWNSTLPYYEICAMADASGMGFSNVRTVLCGEHAVNQSSTNYFLKLNSTSNCNTDVAILSDFTGGTVDGVWTYTASGWVAMSKFEVITPVLVYIRLIINESRMKLEVHNKSDISEITVSLNRTMFLAYAQ